MSFRLSKALLLVTALSLAMALVAILPSVWAAFHGQTSKTPATPCPDALASHYGPLHCALGTAAGLHRTTWGAQAGELLPAAHWVPESNRADTGLDVEGDQTGAHELPPQPVPPGAQ